MSQRHHSPECSSGEASTVDESEKIQVRRGWSLGFVTVPNTVLDDTSLSASELLVYLALLRFCDTDHECFPSIPRIAELARCGQTSAKTAIASLIEKGYITREVRRYNSSGPRSNVYTLYPEPQKPTANSDPSRPTETNDSNEDEAITPPEGYAAFMSALRDRYPELSHDGKVFYFKIAGLGFGGPENAAMIARALLSSSDTVGLLGWNLNKAPSSIPKVAEALNNAKLEAKTRAEKEEKERKELEALAKPCVICGGRMIRHLGEVVCEACDCHSGEGDSYPEILALPSPEERLYAYQRKREQIEAEFNGLISSLGARGEAA